MIWLNYFSFVKIRLLKIINSVCSLCICFYLLGTSILTMKSVTCSVHFSFTTLSVTESVECYLYSEQIIVPL